MTMQVTTHESQDGQGRRTPLVLTLLLLAALGAIAFWQLRPGNDGAAAPTAVGVPPSSGSTTTATDGVMPLGGLAERYHAAARAGVDDAAPPFGVVALTDGAGHYRTEADDLLDADLNWGAAVQTATTGLAPRAGHQAATAAGLEIVVTTDDEAAVAYRQVIEWLRTLDGTTPVDVTVVVDGAAIRTLPSAFGACDATVGPADC